MDTLRTNCTRTRTFTTTAVLHKYSPVCFGLRNRFGTYCRCITIASYCSYLAHLVNGTSLVFLIIFQLWCSHWVLKPFVATPKKVGLLLSFLARKHDLVCATTHFSSSHGCERILAISGLGIITIQSKKNVR